MPKKVLDKCYRVLKPNGRLLRTVAGSMVSYIRHKITYWDKDQSERGMEEREVYGFSKHEIKALLNNSGFKYIG